MYSLALADYSKPPQVLALEATGCQGQAGTLVRVLAHDPYGVAAVQVQVLDAAGQVLEEGPAELVANECWAYATTQPRPIRPVRPGSCGRCPTTGPVTLVNG